MYPAVRVVAVRMRKPEASDYGARETRTGESDGYPAFRADVAALFDVPGAGSLPAAAPP